MSIFDYFKGAKLTEDQRDFLIEYEQFRLDNDINIFLLKGFAGTGKTFITKGIIDQLVAEGVQYELMAPTGKASSVLASKTGRNASTIHRAIYGYYHEEKMLDSLGNYSQDSFITRAKLKGNTDSPEIVYIVDEASMVSNQYSKSDDCTFGWLLNDLIRYADLHNFKKRKLIFIGDNAQLPPVRDIFSPALCSKYFQENYNLSCQSFELTDVVRQKKDSGVLKNANLLRSAEQAEGGKSYKFNVDYSDVSLVEHHEVMSLYYEICGGDVKATDEAIVIASTNLKVHRYNTAFRAKLCFPCGQLQVGEKIICVKNHPLPGEDNYVFNGEFGRVLAVSPEVEYRGVFIDETIRGKHRSKFVELQFVNVTLQFCNAKGGETTVHKKILLNLLFEPVPQVRPELKRAIRIDFLNRNPSLDPKKRPEEYHEAASKDPYINILHIKFGYAITCHKAQGSEWPHVFVDTYVPKQNIRDYNRWLYTAITRTSNNLYVYDWLEFKSSSSGKDKSLS